MIVGAGKGGVALLDLFHGDPGVTVVAVCDVNPRAPGMLLARRLGIAAALDYRRLLEKQKPDLVIDVTGDPAVEADLHRLKPPGTEVIGGTAALFLWELIEEKRKKEDIEGRYHAVQKELQDRRDSEFIVGKSLKMKEISRLILKVAPTPTTVLIRGESGTGKEVIAQAIHRYSRLRERMLVTVNCTALTSTLMESELFGHKKGAFTGAIRDKIGLFEKADGGTIFLDEIGDISPETQSKLLRVLQTGEIRPVGDVTTRKVEVRVVAATNRDLERAIARGEFREDLFYRFNTFTITLPPLRERVEDIPLLAYHFLRKAEAKVNKKVEEISERAMDLMQLYHWPGNLRELENIIERAVVLTPSRRVEVEHLPHHIQQSPEGRGGAEGFMEARERALSRFEREALTNYLLESRGNVSKAALKARIPRRTFHRLLAKHAIHPQSFRLEN